MCWRGFSVFLVSSLVWLLAPPMARALPQFAVESGRACNTCHVEPVDWENPELKLRKCSLNCNECHVNPTGGGMRDEGGLFYGRKVLPLLPIRPPLPSPAGGEGAVPPAPGTAARFGGIRPHPTVQVGADLRAMAYFPQAKGEDDAYFPMQTDFHLAVRPYNPDQLNHGRLTILATGGVEGRRTVEFGEYNDTEAGDFADRLFLKEVWALYDDLPYQSYLKAGRFLPAFGWRLDDHTAFIRQGQSFDHERQVTGVEVGLNPNYLYGHLSVYKNTPSGSTPMVGDSGYGGALSGGWRELFWQAGGSAMFESRDDADDLWAGANWALNFFNAAHPPWEKKPWAPVVYLGELDLRNTSPEGGSSYTGLTAFHELNWYLNPSLRVILRYDWQDPDIDFKDDHRHRYTGGIVLHPFRYGEVIAHYRHNDEPAGAENDEGLLQLHVWY